MIKKTPGLYGIMAEFDDPNSLVVAARQAYAAGYRRMNAYTPYPIEEVSEAIGFHRNSLPLIVLIGGIIGGLGGYLLQYYTSVIDYPLNVGGRPFHSWPAFIPVTFETTVLGAALSAVFGMLALNKLPQPYHPVFNTPRFELASRTHFFFCIESNDPKFDAQEVRAFMERVGAHDITDVEF